MKNSKVIIIPFTLPWDHSADYQRQTCLELSRRNYRVVAYMAEEATFFLKERNKRPTIDNIEFYQPTFFLPFRRIKFINELNFFIDKLILSLKLILEKKIIWIFDPQFHSFGSTFTKKTTIYDCVDYQTSTTSHIDKKIRRMEKLLIKKADYFFTNSVTLKRINKKNRKAKLVVQGVKVEDLSKTLLESKKNLKRKRPVIGYLGGINHRLDFTLLFFLIKNNPAWNFELWGPLQKDEQDKKFFTDQKVKIIKKFVNVHWNFSKDPNILSQAISNFDVGIIPYDINQKLNLFSFPMKTFEYLLLGIPTVSTEILELKNPEFKGLISFGRNWEEFEIEIKKFLQKPLTVNEKTKAKNLAVKHSWKNKVGQILFTINKSK